MAHPNSRTENVMDVAKRQMGYLLVFFRKQKLLSGYLKAILTVAVLGKLRKIWKQNKYPRLLANLKWNREAISKLLSNEKYVGSVLLQKTVSFEGYQVKNQSDADKVLLRNHHPTIISRELFEAVQKAKMKRSQAAKE